MLQACALHLYCMKRERAFFAATRFRIDRLHVTNHKKACCRRGYNLDAWPNDEAFISQELVAQVRLPA